jgi:flagellar biosynthesis protein FlhG
MPTAAATRLGDDAQLRRHLAVLFPGYAGDRQALLASLSADEVGRAFKRLALEWHPDRRRSPDGEMDRLARDRFHQAREAYEALSAHASRLSGRRAPDAEETGARDHATAAPAGPRVIAVGGAKGGVGKSTLAASLAAAIAMMGHRVVAVDLDLGGANLHLFLGVRAPGRTLANFWSDGATSLADLCVETEVPGLSLVAGDSSSLGASNIDHFQKLRLLRHLRTLSADVVVVDLGGDTTFNTLDFFLHADERLVITTEDPAAVLDAYNMVKVGLLRWLSRRVTGSEPPLSLPPAAEACCRRFVDTCGRPGGVALPAFLAELGAIDRDAAASVERALGEFRPRLVLNQAGPEGGRAVIERVRDVCREHLRIDVDLHHLVPADARVRHLTRRLGNVVGARVDGEGARAIWAMAHKLLGAAGPVAAARARTLVRTRFFQPPWIFPLLTRALAGVALRSTREEPLVAWHVGADTGEGAYSLAVALDEAGRQGSPFAYHVWATGASEEEIALARRGVYPLVFVDGLQRDTLQRYFLRGTGLSAGMCSVKEPLRERVSFVAGPATLDSLGPEGPADVVLLDAATDALAVMSRGDLRGQLLEHLRPGGLLVVPAWPRAEAPVPGFHRVADGIFAHVARETRRAAAQYAASRWGGRAGPGRAN